MIFQFLIYCCVFLGGAIYAVAILYFTGQLHNDPMDTVATRLQELSKDPHLDIRL